MFRMGNITKGIKPVAGKGIASVNHQVAISNATPRVNQASEFNELGAGKKHVAKKNIIPINKPTYFFLFFFILFIFLLSQLYYLCYISIN